MLETLDIVKMLETPVTIRTSEIQEIMMKLETQEATKILETLTMFRI